VLRGLSGIRVSLAAAGLLVVLLVVLATLQYRWISEISEADQERMRASARRAADGVATDFNLEISRALAHFGLPPRLANHESDLGPQIAENAKRWSAESRFPSLIAEILVARPRGEKDDLDRVNLSTGSLKSTEWPSELEAARQWIKTRPSTSLHETLQLGLEGKGPETLRWFGPQMIDEIPAILIPDMRLQSPPGEFPKQSMAERWIILRLDRRAIVTGFLPQLIRRQFGESGDYDVAVLRRDDPREVLYRSREGFPPSPLGTPDAEVFFFGLGFGTGGPDRDDRPAGAEVLYFGGPSESGTPDRGDRFVARNGEGHLQVQQEGPLVRFGHVGPLVGPGRGAWRLVALHRAGSLQAAVQATRRRNIAVSGAILLLLAAVVAALLTSAQRAQRLARQQIEFVAGLTHELRTPLAAIRSAGQNLADGLISERDRVRQYGRLLEREGRRLSELIENALAHAGIEARREGLRKGLIGVSEVLEEAIAACRPLALQHDASLEMKIATNLPPIAGDPSALRTVFENLVSNAIKYGGREGQVAVEAHAVGPSIEVEVRDRGPGISPRDLPRIFEPFYRGNDSSSEKVAGSGLGLSLVRRLVEAHGGRVSVESEPGKGTTFRVLLPAASESSRGISSETKVAS